MNLATIRLVNAYFWKTYYGPLFTMLFPVAMLIILGNILRIEYVYPGIVALSTMFVGVLSMPLLLSELKSSSLFKYIGTTAVSPIKLIMSVIIYFFFIAVASTVLILLMTMAIFSSKVFPHHNYNEGIFSGLNTNAGAWSFMFSWLLHFVFSIAIGVLMFSVMGSGQHMAVVAFAIAIPSMFLSGMILSVDIISQSTAMQWISRFDPFRYTTGNLVVSATPRTQLGDLFHVLSISDKKMIFKDGAHFTLDDSSVQNFFNIEPSTGNILIQHFENGVVKTSQVIDDASSLKQFILPLPKATKDAIVFDYTLFRLLFESKAPIVGSSNNVFSFLPWGVRRIPDINVIKTFVQDYFRGESGTGDNTSRFDTIWNNIKQGQYSWMDVFFKQNTTLYYVGDRVANIFVPIVLPAGMLFVSWKKFTWKSQ